MKSNSAKVSTPKKLYRDQNNFFFLAHVNIFNRKLADRNVCIDTGSDITFAMPKLYKEIRDLIQDRPIKVLTATESFGTMNKLGKVIPQLNFILGADTFILKSVPAIFRSNSSVVCDLILGKDFLKNNLISFSLRNRYI